MSAKKVDRFLNQINSLQRSNIRDTLGKIYTEDVLFIDPIKTIVGVEALTVYFEKLYQRVSHCEFKMKNFVDGEPDCSLQWEMSLVHKGINNAREIKLDGASFIQFNDAKVCFHRDYYDLGALIYERIPILGSIVKRVRHGI